VASEKQGFDSKKFKNGFKKLIPDKFGRKFRKLIPDFKLDEACGVWIVGLGYKILDASTTEQVNSNYFEQKMEIGSKGSSMFGLSRRQAGGETLDSLVQRLVQQAVADIDRKK